MNGILHISEAANLGLHAGMVLARQAGASRSARAMAEDLGVSYNHLAKVLNRLERAGFVHAVRGPGGGFRLAKPADHIRLMDLYEALDGPFPRNQCLFGYASCPGGACVMGDLLENLNRQVRDRLESTRLSAFENPSSIAQTGVA